MGNRDKWMELVGYHGLEGIELERGHEAKSEARGTVIRTVYY